jgi:hypothetical protein
VDGSPQQEIDLRYTEDREREDRERRERGGERERERFR